MSDISHLLQKLRTDKSESESDEDKGYKVFQSYDGVADDKELFTGTRTQCVQWIKKNRNKKNSSGKFSLDILSPQGRFVSYMI